jgi:hypothetical protein
MHTLLDGVNTRVTYSTSTTAQTIRDRTPNPLEQGLADVTRVSTRSVLAHVPTNCTHPPILRMRTTHECETYQKTFQVRNLVRSRKHGLFYVAFCAEEDLAANAYGKSSDAMNSQAMHREGVRNTRVRSKYH